MIYAVWIPGCSPQWLRKGFARASRRSLNDLTADVLQVAEFIVYESALAAADAYNGRVVRHPLLSQREFNFSSETALGGSGHNQ